MNENLYSSLLIFYGNAFSICVNSFLYYYCPKRQKKLVKAPKSTFEIGALTI